MLPRMPRARTTRATDLSAQDARRLLLHGQGLLGDPARKATPAALEHSIRAMGFVQVDTINVVARAHDITMGSRLDGYRPEHLGRLLERRRLFEHWTHDASVLHVDWFVPWRHRCRRMIENQWNVNWLSQRIGGDWKKTVRKVRERIREEGPLMSRDFQRADGQRSSPWWGWKPAKAALEYLWWAGDLTVTKRVNFQKVYDLTERCFPELLKEEPPTREVFVDWACREAMARLAVATPSEVRGFHGAVSLAEARAWCKASLESGTLRRVTVGAENGARPTDGYALPDVRRRLARADKALESLPDRMRFLSPFDPAIRDRKRTARLFGFDYRFEAFTPAAKRVYGYYVLPVLRGDRLVARADAKTHRKEGVLELKSLHWEAGRGRTKKERRLLDEAAARLATLARAESVRLPSRDLNG